MLGIAADAGDVVPAALALLLLRCTGGDAQNVAFGPDLRKEDKKKTAEEVSRMLALVGLAGFEKRRISSLSGGQQQRVAIARAIVTHPLLLLADEPTGSLDSHRSVEIMELLTDLNKSEHITVVLVTHEPDMAAYARRCVRCVDGRIASDTEQPGR